MRRARFRSILRFACLLTTATLPAYVPAQSLSTSWLAVTNTNDSGPGSLRAAILAVNDYECRGGTKTIRFNIAGGGPKIIYLRGPLPAISCRVHINGYWQPGSRPNSLSSGDDRVINIGLKAAYLMGRYKGEHPSCAATSILSFVSGAAGSSVRGIAFDNAQLDWGDPDLCVGSVTGIVAAVPISIFGNTIGLWPEGNGGNLVYAVEVNAKSQTLTPGGPFVGVAVGSAIAADRNIVAASSIVFRLDGLASHVSITNNLIGFDPATGSRVSGTAIRCGTPMTPSKCQSRDLTIAHNVFMTPAGIEFLSSQRPQTLSNVDIRDNYFGVVPWDVSIEPALPLTHALFISSDSHDIDAEAFDGSIYAGTLVADNTFRGFATAIELQEFTLSWLPSLTPRVLLSGNSISGSTTAPILMVGGNGDPLVNDALDADTGPNDLQNFPAIGAVDSAGNVSGKLESAPHRLYDIEFFANSSCHPLGYGEAERPWFRADVVTDADGLASFTLAAPYALTANEFVTAIATDRATGQSSVLSPCTMVQ